MHENEFGGHRSLIGDDNDGDNYIENSEDHELEDCNLVNNSEYSSKLMMASFEPLTHMRALDMKQYLHRNSLGTLTICQHIKRA